MWGIIKLLNVDFCSFELNDGSFIIIHVSIVWSRENGYDNWEPGLSIPFVHLISL